MALVPIDLPPGVYRNGTKYATAGRWWDANLVRWVDGIMHPVGGWHRVSTAPLARKARSLFAWRTNSGGRWTAVPTSNQLLVTQADGRYYDITPTLLVPGSDDATEQLGYGGGTYGSGLYGRARTGGTYRAPMTWQLDSWGDNLVACARNDGRIYQWALATGTPAAVVANAPTNCLGLIVSDQRHLITFGSDNNGRLVRWSGKENNTLWTPAADNEAGRFELQTGGTYMRAVKVFGQILINTDTDAHVMAHIGQPYIFSRKRIAEGCGIIGPLAISVTAQGAIWMGDKQFWIFDGASVQPVYCEVADYVFGDINLFQGHKIVSGVNSAYGEVWWWYPGAGQTEPDRYVIYNYIDKHWSIGRLPRTAWQDRGVFPQALAMGADNHLYRHEEGWTDAGATRVGQIYAESGALELDNGNQVGDILQIIPDEKMRGQVSVSFEAKFTPNGASYNRGPYTVRGDGYTDARLSGRQVAMRISAAEDADFSIGKWRLDVRGGSRR